MRVYPQLRTATYNGAPPYYIYIYTVSMEELDLYLYAIVVFFKNIFFSSQLVFVSLLFRSAWVFSFSFVIRRYLVTLRVSR